MARQKPQVVTHETVTPVPMGTVEPEPMGPTDAELEMMVGASRELPSAELQARAANVAMHPASAARAVDTGPMPPYEPMAPEAAYLRRRR